jgi:hypothetical protein
MWFAGRRRTHFFFSCSLAKFAWSVLRQLLGCVWRPSNFAQFHHILSSLTGMACRLLWLLFLAQSWALWLIRNKLTIEKKVPNHPSDVIFKTMLFLQLWSINSKTRDQKGLCRMINELRELYSAMRPSSGPWRLLRRHEGLCLRSGRIGGSRRLSTARLGVLVFVMSMLYLCHLCVCVG